MRYILIFLVFLSSCGIKANTQVLLTPKVELLRIGEDVYVRSLEGEIAIEGFQRFGNYFHRKDPSAFCFAVKRIEGKSMKYCVDKALENVPYVDILEQKEMVVLKTKGFDLYALYPYTDNTLDIRRRIELKGEIAVDRTYQRICYALTGVERGRESKPKVFCIQPKEPPKVRDVQDLGFRVVKDRLFLIWSYDGSYSSFIIYQNGKPIGETKGFMFEIPLPSQGMTFTIKVRTEESFISEGKSINYSP